MKKIAIIAAMALFTFLGQSPAKAQGKFGADSAECIKYLSYYTEYYKQKNYDEALPNWRKAYKLCPPQARQGIFIDGTVLVRRLINKNVANKAYRQALIDTLMTLHDTRAEYYPKYAVTTLNNKGTDISNYYKGNNEAIFKGLEDIIGRLGDDTKANLLLFDLNSAIELYQEGNAEVDAEKVISTTSPSSRRWRATTSPIVSSPTWKACSSAARLPPATTSSPSSPPVTRPLRTISTWSRTSSR